MHARASLIFNPKKVKFEFAYDLAAVFTETEFMNISAIAERAGVNPSLMRQYASGVKYPSTDKIKHIETVFRDLGKRLLSIRLSTPQNNLR